MQSTGPATTASSFEARKRDLLVRLQKALEIELTTIPPYLVAALTIKPGSNVEPKQIIHSVFMEEMLHMLLVANTLTALGGRVALGAANIPRYPCHLEFRGKGFRDRQFDINLQRFSPEAIEIFKKIELPDNFPPAAAALALNVVVEGFTLGEFYRGIIADLRGLCTEAGEPAVFTGDPAWQLNEEYYWRGGGRPVAVTDLASAERALNIVIDQGEGTDGGLGDGDTQFDQPDEVAHYFRFNEIACGRRYRATDDPHLPPTGEAMPVDYGQVYPIKSNCRVEDFGGDVRLLALNHSFNQAYSLMLAQIEEAFRGNPRTLYTAIMNGMHLLPSRAGELMNTPLPGDPGQSAAPTFEWVKPALG